MCRVSGGGTFPSWLLPILDTTFRPFVLSAPLKLCIAFCAEYTVINHSSIQLIRHSINNSFSHCLTQPHTHYTALSFCLSLHPPTANFVTWLSLTVTQPHSHLALDSIFERRFLIIIFYWSLFLTSPLLPLCRWRASNPTSSWTIQRFLSSPSPDTRPNKTCRVITILTKFGG